MIIGFFIDLLGAYYLNKRYQNKAALIAAAIILGLVGGITGAVLTLALTAMTTDAVGGGATAISVAAGLKLFWIHPILCPLLALRFRRKSDERG